jgi:hypothetical protein
MGRHRIVKKKIPSVAETIQLFVDNRKYDVPGPRGITGDVFYSDIYNYVRDELKLKGPLASNMFCAVCDGLRERKFWVHS